MIDLLKKILGDTNEKEIKKLAKTAQKIEELEHSIMALSDTELRGNTEVFKTRLVNGELIEDILPEAFACVREASRRVLDMRHFNVQLIGGIVLHQGRIAEMKTGEGKTLVATLPAYLNALSGKGVHIVTVNDYLARRDSEWMGKIHRFLGLSVGLIVHGLKNDQKREGYSSDITYGTNNEFGFDYLRDNMVIYKEDMVQRDLNYAIVDEVDSILVDEARTPLIISGAGDKSTQMYSDVDRFVSRLKADQDFELDEKARTVHLTEEGVSRSESYFGVTNLASPENITLVHHINQALKAYALMRRDRDYVVKEGQVIIVDEFTGRLMMGRRYSDGLHQAIEAKESVKVERESKTLATITFQNYFRMYKKLAGMTGTAKTEEEEFRSIYGLDVVAIPTDRPMIRKDYNDFIYTSVKGKFNAVTEEIAQKNALGQPVLVGTVSIENSEIISDMLKAKGVPHQVLNAKFHEREAEIVAQAGRFKGVTIATNMAGRGTDIILGGNPEFLAKQELRTSKEFDADIFKKAESYGETLDEQVLAARVKFRELYNEHAQRITQERKKIIEQGGLHIIGTERHESRRIDNQLRGRSGRQGDPGSSRFYISLEDDLMRLFGSDKIKSLVEKLGMDDEQPIEYGLLSKQIEQAQKKVEGRNFNIRKHVLQYDDVMNVQRGIIYTQRKKVLEGEDVRDAIMDMVVTAIVSSIAIYCSEGKHPEQWDIRGLLEHLERMFLPKDAVIFSDEEILELTKESLKDNLIDAAQSAYRKVEELNIADRMREVERVVLLRIVDQKWMDHIDAMDQLRQGIGLRAYGQRDPVIEYKVEGFDMFEEMIRNIQEETIAVLYRIRITENVPKREKVAEPLEASHGHIEKKPVVKGQKIGRNDPCPCGSGKKYKKCCMQ